MNECYGREPPQVSGDLPIFAERAALRLRASDELPSAGENPGGHRRSRNSLSSAVFPAPASPAPAPSPTTRRRNRLQAACLRTRTAQTIEAYEQEDRHRALQT
jgi:hypothetical protein